MNRFEALRKEVLATGLRRGRPIPGPLRARLGMAAAELRANGKSYDEIAGSLGVSSETARRLAAEGEREPSVALVPVTVVAEPKPMLGCLEVVSPSGFRLIGLDAATAIAVFRGLECS